MIEVELPTGTVTLLFTDIEGSTRLLRSLGEEYGAVLGAHRAILRAAVGRHGGVEVGTEGDACFVAFPAAPARPAWPWRPAGPSPPGSRTGWFVPLATVADPARVGLAVVEALRLPNPRGLASIDAEAEHLRDWSALLVLDNFEHVAVVAGWVGELLGRAAGLRLLVTSRIILGLTGEHEDPVRPLGPEEATTLFVQRARAVRPRLHPGRRRAAGHRRRHLRPPGRAAAGH